MVWHLIVIVSVEAPIEWNFLINTECNCDNLELNEPFDDWNHILYFNGAYMDDFEIGKLMHDHSCWDPDDMNFELLKSLTRYYKENPEGVEIMCKAFEETRNEKAIRIAKNMIELNQFPLELIAQVTELPLEKVQELAGKKTAWFVT